MFICHVAGTSGGLSLNSVALAWREEIPLKLYAIGQLRTWNHIVGPNGNFDGFISMIFIWVSRMEGWAYLCWDQWDKRDSPEEFLNFSVGRPESTNISSEFFVRADMNRATGR